MQRMVTVACDHLALWQLCNLHCPSTNLSVAERNREDPAVRFKHELAHPAGAFALS
jgi:hypothetical protein